MTYFDFDRFAAGFRAAARHFFVRFRQIDDQTSRRDIDLRHRHRIERHQLGIAAGARPHFEQIAGAEIVDRDHGAELFAGAIDGGKPDQIGVIKFVRFIRLRQPLARHVEPDIGQLLGGVAVGNARQPRHEIILGRPQAFDRQHPAVLGLERTVTRDRRRIGGERAQADLAAHAVGGADLAEANAPAAGHRSLTRWRRGRGRCCGRSGRRAGAGRRAGGRGSLGGFFLRLALFARNRPFRIVARLRFITPAASRKRMMRSDGCAPLAIQALAFSRSHFSRSVFSFGNSGLK